MFKLNTKYDADSLLYLLSHFECDCHLVHMLTQQCLPPPLTSTVKLSLFTHAHSSPPPWLPGYLDVAQTILIILTMAGLFLDRPCIPALSALFPDLGSCIYTEMVLDRGISQMCLPGSCPFLGQGDGGTLHSGFQGLLSPIPGNKSHVY